MAKLCPPDRAAKQGEKLEERAAAEAWIRRRLGILGGWAWWSTRASSSLLMIILYGIIVYIYIHIVCEYTVHTGGSWLGVMASAFATAGCAMGSTFELPRSLDTRLTWLTWLNWPRVHLTRTRPSIPEVTPETCTVHFSSLFPSRKDDG